jgi:hypothetical protein
LRIGLSKKVSVIPLDDPNSRCPTVQSVADAICRHKNARVR